ncbi:hypothetical protein [Propionibacterium freudenreichii]|uniref:hypothetical protein n=1 Tax=Propionibacterium freudenreichii TaxID=1744 RepID=UPI0020B11948|nr:hypothetical protein [Propionibacterium freudenreichii]
MVSFFELTVLKVWAGLQSDATFAPEPDEPEQPDSTRAVASAPTQAILDNETDMVISLLERMDILAGTC